MGKGKRKKTEKELENMVDAKMEIEMEEKKEKRRKTINTIWKIWWIGIVILFIILSIQTYMIKSGS